VAGAVRILSPLGAGGMGEDPHAQVAASESRTVAYIPGADRSVGRLAWADRSGRVETLPVPERVYGAVDVDSDGGRIAVHVADVVDYVWIYWRRDEGRKVVADGPAGWPLFSPDGRSIVFSRFGRGETGLVRQALGDGGGPPESRHRRGRRERWCRETSYSPYTSSRRTLRPPLPLPAERESRRRSRIAFRRRRSSST